MSEMQQARLDAEFTKAIDAITAADLAALVPQIERFGVGGELDAIVRTARPNAKVQRRFLPAAVQGEIFKAALRHGKAQELAQDVVIGLYAQELGDAVNDPTLDQLRTATDTLRTIIAPALLRLTLLGVVAREEVAAPHAVTVLRDSLDCDLTK